MAFLVLQMACFLSLMYNKWVASQSLILRLMSLFKSLTLKWEVVILAFANTTNESIMCAYFSKDVLQVFV